MLLRRAQRPQPRGQAHPGHGMSFGQGEGAAQPALCPVPSASPCLQPACAVPTALPVLTAPGDETETGAEGHGAALPVPRSIPCRSVSPGWHSHGSILAQSRGQDPAPLPKGPQPHTEGAARAGKPKEGAAPCSREGDFSSAETPALPPWHSRNGTGHAAPRLQLPVNNPAQEGWLSSLLCSSSSSSLALLRLPHLEPVHQLMEH